MLCKLFTVHLNESQNFSTSCDDANHFLHLPSVDGRLSVEPSAMMEMFCT